MKVKTDFGIQEIKPQKVFEYEGFKFAIVKHPEQYRGIEEPLIIRRVIEFTTTITLGVSIQRGDTLKTIEQKAVTLLESFKRRGADLKTEIENYEKLN